MALWGTQNYQRVADVTGIPVYDNPDLMLVPEVSARVLFTWMTDPQLGFDNTLDHYTSGAHFDLVSALKGFRGGPRGSETTINYVTEANRRFLKCIQAAKLPN
jgi:hypothetical protein